MMKRATIFADEDGSDSDPEFKVKEKGVPEPWRYRRVKSKSQDENHEEVEAPKFADPNMNTFYRKYFGERLAVRGKLLFLFMLQMLLIWFIFLESQTNEDILGALT